MFQRLITSEDFEIVAFAAVQALSRRAGAGMIIAPPAQTQRGNETITRRRGSSWQNSDGN